MSDTQIIDAEEAILNFEPCPEIDRFSSVPLHRQLFLALRRQIIDGGLSPGQLMPSTRGMADHLDVSRSTVVRAYDDLLGQGYIKAVDGIGTYVAETRIDNFRVHASVQLSTFELSRTGMELLATSGEPLQSHKPALLDRESAPSEFLPVKQWRQIVFKYFREYDSAAQSAVVEALGYVPLREALASYLRRARAITCQSSQIAVFPGSLDALKLLSMLLLDKQEAVIVENPGSCLAARQFAAQGAQIIQAPVDEEGLRIDFLHNSAVRAKMLYLTPSHHDPTGVVMSLDRRRQLLAWAQSNHTLIVEDDYDSEYRFDGNPIPALHAMSTTDGVVYLSSFRRTLYPLVDVSYLVTPPWMVQAVAAAMSANIAAQAGTLPMLEQNTLTEFIAGGHMERHIRKMQPLFRSRWRAAVAALTKYLKNELRITKGSSSSHIFVRFTESFSEAEIATAAEAAQVELVNLRGCYYGHAPGGEFMIPFASYSEAEIDCYIERFAKVLKESVRLRQSDYAAVTTSRAIAALS